MELFVVLAFFYDDPPDIVGVFPDKEVAIAAGELAMAHGHHTWVYVEKIRLGEFRNSLDDKIVWQKGGD